MRPTALVSCSASLDSGHAWLPDDAQRPRGGGEPRLAEDFEFPREADVRPVVVRVAHEPEAGRHLLVEQRQLVAGGGREPERVVESDVARERDRLGRARPRE